MADQNGKSWLETVGCYVSSWVADIAAHPYAQIGFIVVCVAWFVIGFNINVLTAALSIMAITLTQMVLNNQNEREAEAHRRDVAMHAKLDELISASRQARNDLVGLEDRDEQEIVQLKEEVKDALDDGPGGSDQDIRDTIKEVVEDAAEEIKQEAIKANGSEVGKAAEAKA
jgi:low affinity Fe/Cu permease